MASPSPPPFFSWLLPSLSTMSSTLSLVSTMSSTLSSLSTMFSTLSSLSTMASTLSSGLRLSTTLSVSVFSVLRRARKTAVFFSVSAATLFFFPFLFSALRFTAVFSPASSPPPFFSSLVPSLSTMSSRLSSGLRLSTTFSVFAVLPFTPAFLTSFFLEASFGVSV